EGRGADRAAGEGGIVERHGHAPGPAGRSRRGGRRGRGLDQTGVGGRMSPQERMDTRTRIVLAAMELFWAKGYNSTSVADILSRTQLNAGSLYHVFPGKQDVLIAVLEAYRDGI